MSTSTEIANSVQAILDRQEVAVHQGRVVAAGTAALPILRDYLHRDLDIDSAEEVEALLKLILKGVFSQTVSGELARELVGFQKKLGLIPKYKSYAVKAASPLGYCIFLQNECEGCSFQQHTTHKVEVFHILAVKPGGYVFLCDYADWEKHYEPAVFEAWMGGEPHPFFDRRRFTPVPGDVFVISELGVVHTVVGCVFEEFATVSTDMVDRLHDQNLGKPMPAFFNREYVGEELRKVRLPRSHRIVDLLQDGPPASPLEPVEIPGGERVVFTDSFVAASNVRLEAHAGGAVERSAERATFVRVADGVGRVSLADDTELGRLDDRAIPLASGDTLFVPPGIHYRISSEAGGDLEYSEHRISPDVAFV